MTNDSHLGQSNDGDTPAPSAAALRMRRHRERRRDGLRCMTIELRETEVTALIISSLALLLHEFITNATRYGALRRASRRIC